MNKLLEFVYTNKVVTILGVVAVVVVWNLVFGGDPTPVVEATVQ